MIRRFNYTQRQRLLHDHLLLSLFTDDASGFPAFKAALDISAYDFPTLARVYVEAYFKSSMMRFDYGTVSDVASRAGDVHLLDDLQGNNIYFRVKVVDETDDIGRLLAVADKVDPKTDAFHPVDKLPLLHVVFSSDLGRRIWRVDTAEAQVMPTLEVNDTLNLDIPVRELVRKDPMFVSLVFPAVIEQILTYIFFIAEDVDIQSDASHDWRSAWVRYAMQQTRLYTDIQQLDDLDTPEKQDWIQETVQRFCHERDVAQLFTDEINQGN